MNHVEYTMARSRYKFDDQAGNTFWLCSWRHADACVGRSEPAALSRTADAALRFRRRTWRPLTRCETA